MSMSRLRPKATGSMRTVILGDGGVPRRDSRTGLLVAALDESSHD